MAINLESIGRESEPVSYSYNEDDVILYALGIGAGVDELDFIYEKHLKVFPTYAVIPFTSMLFSHVIPLTNINPAALLHGEQKIILHKPIPTSATVHATMCVDSIYDKGDKGAIINLTLETTDDAGEALFDNKVVLMDRSGGNFGGDRGPKTTPVVPPEGQDPDFSVAYTIPPDQAAIYRLSGDKNPLHIDPAYAQKARFDRPILHGLCSFGYAGRAILHSVCGSDPARMKSFSVRFMNVVYPGDTLTTHGWKTDRDGTYVVVTLNQNGKIVLGNTTVELQ